MTWPKIVLVAWLALGALMTIGRIGKARQPITPTEAVATVVATAAMVALLVIA
jgi:hypothetical protein